jgi:HTH-type transcriptional regulator/antitoxin HigA
MSAKTNQFIPDYAVPPAETMKEAMKAFRMTPADLAQSTGLPIKTVGALLVAQAPITAEIAAALERTFGPPARFWLDLEALYQEDCRRLALRKGGGR